jgi:hypothetical protein
MNHWSILPYRIEQKSKTPLGAPDMEVKHGYIPKNQPNSHST